MKQNKILIIIIGILVMINLVTLSFLWKGPMKDFGNNPDRAERFLEKKLKLNDEQIEMFNEARERHFEEIDKIQRQIGEARRKLAESGEESDKIDELVDQIGKLHMRLERANINHFRELRAVCNQDQKVVFDSLFNKISEPPRHRMHRRH